MYIGYIDIIPELYFASLNEGAWNLHMGPGPFLKGPTCCSTFSRRSMSSDFDCCSLCSTLTHSAPWLSRYQWYDFATITSDSVAQDCNFQLVPQTRHLCQRLFWCTLLPLRTEQPHCKATCGKGICSKLILYISSSVLSVNLRLNMMQYIPLCALPDTLLGQGRCCNGGPAAISSESSNSNSLRLPEYSTSPVTHSLTSYATHHIKYVQNLPTIPLVHTWRIPKPQKQRKLLHKLVIDGLGYVAGVWRKVLEYTSYILTHFLLHPCVLLYIAFCLLQPFVCI